MPKHGEIDPHTKPEIKSEPNALLVTGNEVILQEGRSIESSVSLLQKHGPRGVQGLVVAGTQHVCTNVSTPG